MNVYEFNGAITFMSWKIEHSDILFNEAKLSWIECSIFQLMKIIAPLITKIHAHATKLHGHIKKMHAWWRKGSIEHFDRQSSNQMTRIYLGVIWFSLFPILSNLLQLPNFELNSLLSRFYSSIWSKKKKLWMRCIKQKLTALLFREWEKIIAPSVKFSLGQQVFTTGLSE